MKNLILITLLFSGACARAEENLSLPIAEGPFKPSWESLQQYQCPEWFRDAKFGIWAHWDAPTVPEQGPFYAKDMYIEGSPDNKFHVKTYGHPSKFGFKDIDNLWKAEKWDPEQLIALYKRAGAQYFVALANHHDNFDCFDSKFQPWNSVKIGPKRDIVGDWAKAARASGMHFGVSVHAARAPRFFEHAQGADKSGPMAGVPYDGKLTKADGKGLWWEGLDPQDLYAQNQPPGSNPDAAYCQKFYNRMIDLIDKYQLDLLYFDDLVLPLRNDKKIGLSIAAHLYNTSLKNHNGRNDAVMNTKELNEAQRKCLIYDIERAVSDRVEPFAWQTDTCIGRWFYNNATFKRHSYSKPAAIIRVLVDIVSKNGNLLLNVPIKGDGTIDSDEVAILEDIAKWMTVSSECIFGTRPWKVYGEGRKFAKGSPGDLNKDRGGVYTAEDIRFTTKGNTLYAIALGWPENGQLIIKTLGKKQAGLKGDITSVQLLGSSTKLAWTRSDAALNVTLPAQKPCEYAWALKIEGLDLAASQPTECMTIIPFVGKPVK